MANRKSRILFAIPSLAMGGAERLTVYLLKYLDRERFEIGLCLFENRGELLKKVPKDVRIFDLKKKSRWSFFKMLRDFNKVVSEYRPDVVYSRMWYATSVATASRLLFSYKIPIVATEEHNCKKDIAERDLFGRFKRLFIDWSYRKADVAVVPSEGVKKDISESYRLEPGKVHVIYNSVDLDLIHRSTASNVKAFDDDAPVIAAFGRLIARKGFPDLIEAFKIIRSRRPCHLVFIGEGEERSNLERLTESMGLNGDVRFLGYQENPFGLIAGSDVFVLSSHWEGFGNVIVEAMACGVPVVSTRCPHGPDEIITDGVNGLLIPVGDTEAMAHAILRVLDDEALRKRLAETGRKRAENFRVERMVADYERVFEKIYTLESTRSSHDDKR